MRAGETEDIEGKYKTLKKQRFEAVDKFSYISLLSQRLIVLVDSTDSDLYDFENLLTDIRLTVEELNNCRVAYSEMLEKFVESQR